MIPIRSLRPGDIVRGPSNTVYEVKQAGMEFAKLCPVDGDYCIIGSGRATELWRTITVDQIALDRFEKLDTMK